jgi:hypothetical protein
MSNVHMEVDLDLNQAPWFLNLKTYVKIEITWFFYKKIQAQTEPKQPPILF